MARAASSRVFAIADRGGYEGAIDVLVDAVGGEDEDVAPLDLERAVIDLDLRLKPTARLR
jgi:hypothetical protein